MKIIRIILLVIVIGIGFVVINQFDNKNSSVSSTTSLSTSTTTPGQPVIINITFDNYQNSINNGIVHRGELAYVKGNNFACSTSTVICANKVYIDTISEFGYNSGMVDENTGLDFYVPANLVPGSKHVVKIVSQATGLESNGFTVTIANN